MRLLTARYEWNTTREATIRENTMAMSSATMSKISRVVFVMFAKDSEI